MLMPPGREEVQEKSYFYLMLLISGFRAFQVRDLHGANFVHGSFSSSVTGNQN